MGDTFSLGLDDVVPLVDPSQQHVVAESARGIAPAPFRFCLQCGVAYGFRQISDLSKLATLGSGGRASATSVLSLSTVRHIKREATLPAKLLSFTDNRQDASLQAGHFNDFVEIGQLRSALYRACLAAAPDGLTHEVLTQRVFDALGLPFALYASNPDLKFHAAEETRKARSPAT